MFDVEFRLGAPDQADQAFGDQGVPALDAPPIATEDGVDHGPGGLGGPVDLLDVRPAGCGPGRVEERPQQRRRVDVRAAPPVDLARRADEGRRPAVGQQAMGAESRSVLCRVGQDRRLRTWPRAARASGTTWGTIAALRPAASRHHEQNRRCFDPCSTVR